MEYCIPVNPWQETGKVSVQSKGKLQEIEHHKMVEKSNVGQGWCGCGSQSSVLDCALSFCGL